ncbi:uncharacterized protein PV06_08350 [Exophiala oligosperma]|uniref:Uncharacterized protein n=1 Tax=Exophiala oligosperma TaxID=215243 RepID=A0A0D2DBA0_9EURO|nr:uncharacterized protein PV06_08350 [Exophiala oligosperma]KIW39765.1 hypothetical protein PV06_08350 [Exophiala oligosperma]
MVLEPRLYFVDHLDKIMSKVRKSMAIPSIFRYSTRGITVDELRNEYMATIIPQTLSGKTARYNPDAYRPWRRQPLTSKKVQLRAARIITGTWKPAPADALDVEAHLTPIRLKPKQTLDLTLVRLPAYPQYDVIRRIRQRGEARDFVHQNWDRCPTPPELLEGKALRPHPQQAAHGPRKPTSFHQTAPPRSARDRDRTHPRRGHNETQYRAPVSSRPRPIH